MGYLRAIVATIKRNKALHDMGRKLTLADFFDQYVGSLTVGRSRMSIDPYLRSKIYKYLHEIDGTPGEDSIEGVKRDRKAELRKAMNATRRMPMDITEQMGESAKASIAARRKQRESARKIQF